MVLGNYGASFASLAPIAMTPTRLSAFFLAVAALSGGIGIVLPSVTEFAAEGLDDVLRVLCVGALVAFVVTFLVALDKTALVRR